MIDNFSMFRKEKIKCKIQYDALSLTHIQCSVSVTLCQCISALEPTRETMAAEISQAASHLLFLSFGLYSQRIPEN